MIIRLLAAFVTAFSLLTAQVFAETDVQYLSSDVTKELGLPFSEAVRVGDTLYLSGQLGNLPGKNELVKGGIEAETRQTLDNIKATLERYGAGMDDLVKCTVFMADIAEWPKMNGIYKTYFNQHFPARSAVAGSGLALGARVEIECIAVVSNKN